tara:strand:+ start:2181 stop:2468 length:288 start_codon:yes stop_codon:yes gene_type:complete
MAGNYLVEAGTIISFLIGIIGFFIIRLLNDVKMVIQDTGKNKGRIELVARQQENDIKRIEERTQLELENLTRNVSLLTENVNALCTMLAKKGIEK